MPSKLERAVNAMNTAILKVTQNEENIEGETALDAIENDLAYVLSVLKTHQSLKKLADRTPIYDNVGGIYFHSANGKHYWLRYDAVIVETPWTRLQSSDIVDLDPKDAIRVIGENTIDLIIAAFDKISNIQDGISNYGKASVEVVPGANLRGR